VFGSPQFEKVTVRLPNGKNLRIEANGLSNDNKYVHSVRFRGKPHEVTTISFEELNKGGDLEYQMAISPSF